MECFVCFLLTFLYFVFVFCLSEAVVGHIDGGKERRTEGGGRNKVCSTFCQFFSFISFPLSLFSSVLMFFHNFFLSCFAAVFHYLHPQFCIFSKRFFLVCFSPYLYSTIIFLHISLPFYSHSSLYTYYPFLKVLHVVFLCQSLSTFSDIFSVFPMFSQMFSLGLLSVS